MPLPPRINRQKSGQHTEQQLLTEILDLLLGEPATASNAHSAARTLSSCVLGPRKKLSDKTSKKQKVLFLPKYISVPPNVF